MSKKKIKTSPKIYVLSIFIIIFIAVLAFSSYFTFFADAKLHKLGYTYKEIKLLHQYDIDEKIDKYNQSFVYALNSKEFSQNNINYYLLFDSQMDLTRVCNNLAMYYSIEDVQYFLSFLDSQQVEQLAENVKIEDKDFFEKLYQKGYSLQSSIEISNSLPKNSIDSFLSLGILQEYNCYLNYLKTGYNDSTICAIYHQLGEESFNNLSKMRFFDDSLIHALVNVENFSIDNLPRYLIYLSTHSKATEKISVDVVNSGKDLIKAENIDYNLFYNNPITTSLTNELVLVNKSHQLTMSDVPQLVKVNANYRFTDSFLTQETADMFVEMANQLNKETERNIIAYTNYVSYNQQDLQYSQALIDSFNDETMINKYTFKAGCSEHQTGLAIDVCEKGNTYTKFAGSKSALWLEENAYKFGFILRYKEGKESLTGIEANDYHYRYVGSEAANIINQYDWVLEEYYYLFIGD